MMKNMISNITKKARVGIATLAGIMMMTMATPFTASAQTPDPEPKATEKTTNEDAEAARARLIYQRLDQLTQLNNTKKTINITNVGLYSARNMKVYGRRALCVDYDGNFILDKWEQVNTMDWIDGGGTTEITCTVDGDYVAFAFSFDIMWGTDFPYSGIIWNDIHNTNWKTINIRLGGTCRMANIKVTVGTKTVIDERNCDAHKEWKPE